MEGCLNSRRKDGREREQQERRRLSNKGKPHPQCYKLQWEGVVRDQEHIPPSLDTGKNKPCLNEQLVYKRSSPRTVPNSGGVSTTLSGSEGLASDMVYTAPSTLKTQTRAGSRCPNQIVTSVRSKTLAYTCLCCPTVATGLVSTHHSFRLHTKVTGAEHPGTLQAHTTSTSDSLLGHSHKSTPGPPSLHLFWIQHLETSDHVCFGFSHPARAPPTWSTPDLPPMPTLALVTWPGHPLQ